MLELKFIRDNIEFLEDMLKKRGSDMSLNEFEQLDAERRDILQKVEMLRGKRNNASQEIAKKKKAGEQADDLIKEMGLVGDEIKNFDVKLSEIESRIDYIQKTIPNVFHETVPVGKDE